MAATTITIASDIRDRLKSFGTAGMTYNDILTHLMDEAQRQDFVAQMRRRRAQVPEKDLVDLEDL